MPLTYHCLQGTVSLRADAFSIFSPVSVIAELAGAKTATGEQH
jgi:hypothetical protein